MDNGKQPAFPVTGIETDLSYDQDREKHFPHVYSYEKDAGLTKRELFAAMAMQGALGGEPGPHLQPATLAAESVMHADALLAHLKNTENK